MGDHGYGRYSNGCRCVVCRSAKAAYMREKRAAAAKRRVLAESAGDRYVAVGIRHGLSGYRDSSCRCDVCRVAEAAAALRETRRA